MAIHEYDIRKTQEKYNGIKDCLSEKGRRIWTAIEATAYGYGGATVIFKALGMPTATLCKGIKELKNLNKTPGIIRTKGAGRKSYKISRPGILKALDDLVDPTAKGDPENPLKWTSKSLRNLTDAMKLKGYNVSKTTIGVMLHDLGYSLQANKKRWKIANMLIEVCNFSASMTASWLRINNQPLRFQ